ncbi:uncharacterized protein LOC132826502 [Hemiscyllium ocellatum]|uniref:uncharacterized protein LOC132826502 n=1 Tax=Hemiscyllium ocellatum TaxID=170820 RepID=UPI0029665456|nr:uncharacterized protein LOC132826502 [Hemiscyllium ocellatum]
MGNLSNNDASIMMEGLNQEDAGSYLCRVELNIGSFQMQSPTKLEIEEVSAIDWSMTVANEVRAVEGRTVVLPCSFTHPDTNLPLTGSIIWIKSDTGVIFNCTYPGPDHSQGELCENVIQRDGGNRFRFVGNLSNNDVSLMMEGLSLEDDGFYRCCVEFNIGSFETLLGTDLEVIAAQGNVSVVSGTEGDLVTLPCIFETMEVLNLTTVTWMRKEPYQHIVTFTAQSQGTWTTGHGGNRYELIGNPEEGNASTRINQLSVRDNHTYLCLVEYTSLPLDIQCLIQKESRVQVITVKKTEPTTVYPLAMPLLIILLIIINVIICITFRKTGGFSRQIELTTFSRRNDPDLSSVL